MKPDVLKIEDALKASEDKFKKIFDSTFEGMLVLTSDGVITDANQAFCSSLGYTREEVMALHRDSLLQVADNNTINAVNTRREKGWYAGLLKWVKKNGEISDAEVVVTQFTDAAGESLVFVCTRDVTEKLKAEKDLEGREERFKALLENGRDVITLMDAEGRIIYRSQSYSTVLGYTPEDIARRTPFDDVYPDDLPVLKSVLATLYSRPGERVSAIWRQKHKNGNWLWLEGSAANLLHDPAVKAIINNFRDITERKNAEDKLAHASAELQRLFNSMDEVLYSAERNPYRLIQMSPSCEKLYGYTSSDFFADGDLWEKVILEEDKPLLQNVFRVLNQGKVAREQYRIRHKDGGIRWVSMTVTPTLDDEGVLRRVDGVNRDVTDRNEFIEKLRLSEQRFKALIEKGKDAIAILSKERKIIYLSPSTQNILGYRVEELLGKYSTDLIHPDDSVFSDERVKFLSAAPGNFIRIETRMKHKNGSWVWLEATITNQTDDTAVGGLVINYHDITEHKKAHEEIDALNHSLERKVAERTLELQEANQLLESYNYSVAHDLKSPLRIIAGYAHVLADTAKDRLQSQDKELLDIIMKNSKKMAQLVTDLLHFSQVKQGKIRPGEVSMDSVVADVLETAKLADVSPLATVKVGPLGTAFCDAGLIKQVWTNLITNAFKYSKKNPAPVIEIGAELVDGRTVYFVKDNGVGFESEFSEKLFDVFYRQHRDKDFEGTGVGLALVKSVIEHHHGKIWAEG